MGRFSRQLQKTPVGLGHGAASYLPQLRHGLAGDDLVAVKSGDKAKCLELALAPLQLP